METYHKYLDTWISGIKDEIEFWDRYMKTCGYNGFVTYNWQISTNRVFTLENEIPGKMYGQEYKVLDVGSGPFSRLGQVSNKVKLDMLCVDPLGMVYTCLKERYGIDTGIHLKTGFVEMLDRIVPPNHFDLVHMSNSLDHSFDPVCGIQQLLYACKIGGKVILRHAENEAENENYSGLHQWNLSLKNKENSFIIWRDKKRIDICDILDGYADVQLYPDEVENGSWLHNKVVIKKIKDIQMPPTKQFYYDEMLEHVYRKMLKMFLEMIYLRSTPHQEKIDRIMKKIAVIYQEKRIECEKWLRTNGNHVVIYGMGVVGDALYTLLNKCGADIVAIVDKHPMVYTEKYVEKPRLIRSLRPDEYTWDKKSTILITVIEDIDFLKEWALEKTEMKHEYVACIDEALSSILDSK